MSSARLLKFPHRRNSNGRYDSICPHCFLTAATARTEQELATLEKRHVCHSSFLAERGVQFEEMIRSGKTNRRQDSDEAMAS